MRRKNKKFLELRQYKFQNYGREFYVRGQEHSGLDLDFGCPYGCDAAGGYLGTFHAKMGDMRRGD